MANIHDFDDIRPYTDSEVPEIISRIVRERGFLNFVKMFFPEQSTKKIITELLQIKSQRAFQEHLVYTIVQRIIKGTVQKLTFDGIENLKKDTPYIFMSNHRDIVLDSALLEYILVINNFPTTEIAIGSNLLIMQWIIDLVRLNRSFIVKRDVPHIELYQYSVNLSKYIRFTNQQKNSVWIAQREGRTKDGDDRTQVAVLKMLNLSGENDFFDNFRELNIIPVTIAYELEPCAVSKVQELYNKMTKPEYKKTKLEDLTSMNGGIETPKGHVHYVFGTPINDQLHKIEHIKGRKPRFDALTELIDDEIQRNYRLTYHNYVAADMYFNTKEYEKYYTKEEKKNFTDYYKNSLSQIEGDEKIVSEMFLKIYAMPTKNYFEANTKQESK
ncbi:MAG: 1-acyl-sn-glycerol-3-phosphate acyltransferase [Bacteroidales bacterium]|nr:1-acyl-sn-glycerol-3-phosphate acyltransferase [Bacteroidales bacterium]